MNDSRPHWISKPTKRHILLVGLLWFSGVALSILAMTDVFKENLFQSKNTMMIIVQMIATIVYIKIVKNYYQQFKN
jgi:hypothetical protein